MAKGLVAYLVFWLAVFALCAQTPAATWRCGYERWAVKTGQDATAKMVTKAGDATIALLTHEQSPLPKQTGKYPPQINHRLTGEFSIVTLRVTITAYRVENDSDLHLIMSDGVSTMIGEIPCECCMANLIGKSGMAASPWVNKVRVVRYQFLSKTGYVPAPWTTAYGPPFIKCNIPAKITGVVFFDWPHKQPGAAAGNAVELHPILHIFYYKHALP